MGFLAETSKELLKGAIDRLKLCYAQEIKRNLRFHNKYKRGFMSAIQVLEKISLEFVLRAEALDKKEEEEQKEVKKKIDKAASLARDFLSLPYHATVEIAKELGLHELTDESLSDAERHKQIFTRAKEKGVLLAMRVAVTKKLEAIREVEAGLPPTIEITEELENDPEALEEMLGKESKKAIGQLEKVFGKIEKEKKDGKEEETTSDI